MNVYLWILTFSTCFSFIQTQSCKRDQRCRISRVRRMKAADCHNQEIREFPQCLSSDLEIIDLSCNRIRKLGKNDLSKYSNLKVLYLSDNAIMLIDEETFEGKDDLISLDLSLNSLSKVPPVVFHLPSLSSLYLGQNLNINIVDVVEEVKPITSPLVQLDISYVMIEDVSELPNFGMLPFLIKYNISGNKLMSVTTKHFAGLCSLKTLDTTNVTVEFDQPCDCWTINKWLTKRKVEFNLFPCEVNENKCSDEVSKEDLQIFKDCNEEVTEFYRKQRTLKGFYIAIGVIVPVVFIVVVYFLVRRRRLQRRQQPQHEHFTDQHLLQLNNKT